MRRRALAIVFLAAIAGTVACTTFGSENVEDQTPVPPGADASADTADASIAEGAPPGDVEEIPLPIDSGPPADPLSTCKGRCKAGTRCTVGDTCVVDSQPSCAAPIQVDQPGRYVGRVCKVDGAKQTTHCGEQRHVHVFQVTGTMSTVTVKPIAGSSFQFSVDPMCGAGTCNAVLAINGGGVTTALSTNDFLTIGVPVCANYELVFTK